MNQTEHFYEAERLARLATERMSELDDVQPGQDVRREDLSQEIDQMTALALVHATLAGIVPLTPMVIDRDTPIASAPEWLEKKVAEQ